VVGQREEIKKEGMPNHEKFDKYKNLWQNKPSQVKLLSASFAVLLCNLLFPKIANFLVSNTSCLPFHIVSYIM